MTDVSCDLMDITGFRADGVISVRSMNIREGSLPTDVVTTAWHDFPFTDGDILMTGLDPGPAEVRIRTWNFHDKWQVTVPDSAPEVTLLPLIQAALPDPPDPSGTVVHNAGGVARIQALTQAEYSALPSPDPETLYAITD